MISISLSLGLAGCGDDASDGTPTKTTIAKATLIEKGDAICREADRRREGLRVPGNGDPQEPRRSDLRQLGAFLIKESKLLREELRAIERLGEPDKDRALFDRMIANGDEVLDLATAAGRSAENGDLSAYKRDFKRLLATATKASTGAYRFGFRVCG